MPELPEVECVRRSLQRLVVGRRVEAVRVMRSGVISGGATSEALLQAGHIVNVLRHGKQLALVSDSGPCVCVHLGMSGQLCTFPWPGEQRGRPVSIQRRIKKKSSKSSDEPPRWPAHTHVVWELGGDLGLRFTDPRRFGGLWTFSSQHQLVAERWSWLGPDALTIKPAALHSRLADTRRVIKAALLDQCLIAGLGNIYVDELLYAAQIHPKQPAHTIDRPQVASLVRRMRTLLSKAIERGGSSMRDYVDGENQRGSQQEHHRVYGRAGQTCPRRGCRALIQSEIIAGRTTAWCPGCQPET